MRPLLKHLIELTAHLDQDRLERSVASSLGNLAGAVRVRRLTIAEADGGIVLQAADLMDAQGRAIAGDASALAATAPLAEPIGDYPELLDCIERLGASAERERDDGRYLLWLPVRLDGKIRSCLEITSPKRCGERTRAVILGIFEVYCNYQALLDYSERDALTGLLNRKTFDDQFPRYQAAPVPARQDAGDALQVFALDEDTCRPISEFGAPAIPRGPGDDAADPEQDIQAQWLAVVDIDHFKQVNDRFGHVYGDEVLILVSNILKASFRGDDRIFRFGGEEFVVLVHRVPLKVAHAIFERFRRNVERHDFPQVGRVTISLGFARTDGGTPVEILGRADQALYHAKQNGRNRICHYEELVRDGRLQAGVTHQDIELF